MMIFQNPGGKVDSDNVQKKLKKMQPDALSNLFREGFYEWPGKEFYQFFREIIQYLEEYGFINNEINFKGTNIMQEIYITDACKCRVRTDENDSDAPLDIEGPNGENAWVQCRYNYLLREIDELENLELIIVFGDKAFDAFEQYSAKRNNQLDYLNDETVIIRTKAPLPGVKKGENHGSVYSLKYKNRIDKINVIRFMHPSYLYRWNKSHVIEEIIKSSVKRCFEDIKGR